MNKRLDLVGQKFGRLTVLKYVRNNKRGSLWECMCDCENKTIKIIRGGHLKNGHTRSCGCLKIFRTNKGESGFNSLFYIYKRNAKNRDLEFNLTREEFSGLTQQNCYYCGEEPKQVVGTKRNNKKDWAKYIYNGIDRVNNDKGYIIENCVPCCRKCNRAKDIMSIEEFYEWIKKLMEYIN